MALGRRIETAEKGSFDYYKVLNKRSTPDLSNRVIVPTRARGALPAGFTASAQYLMNLQKSNALRNYNGQNVQFTAAFISRDVVSNAVTGASSAVSRNMALLAAAMGESASRKASMSALHQELARKAHDAVVLDYNGKFGDTLQYRQGQNRESGKLGPAIHSNEWISATRDGILFMDRAYLDRAARHWHRLNFGAMPIGRQKSPKSYAVKFGGQPSSARLSLRGERPSRAFTVPRGLWLNGNTGEAPNVNRRGMDRFFTPKWLRAELGSIQDRGGASDFIQSMKDLRSVERKERKKDPGKTPWTKPVKARGIRGAQFFDAGIKSLAKNMGPAYETLLEKWVDEAEEKGTGPVAKVIARP